MNTLNSLNELNEDIKNAWLRLKEAVKNEDWPITQQGFRQMAALQDLDQELRNLQQRFAQQRTGGQSNETSFAQESPHAHQTPVGFLENTRRGTKRPRELRIGSQRVPISLNNQITIATANWILKQGRTLPKIHNFIHPTNSGFAPSAPTKRLDDGSFIEI